MRKEELLRLIKMRNLKKKGMDKIAYVLNKKGKKELTGLIRQFIEKHPDLKPLVNIEKGELMQKIQGLFSHFWDWNEVRQLMSELETILEAIRKRKKHGDRDLLSEMMSCTNIIIRGTNNFSGEDELALFLEDWCETLGEVFASTKPALREKQEFVRQICGWIKKDDYGFAESFEKALVAMCRSKKDVELIKEFVRPLESSYATAKEHYEGLYEELEEKSI